MIKLKDILNEKLPALVRDTGSPIVKLVFWDEKNEDTLKDPKKVKEILRVLERNLNAQKSAKPQYDFSIPQIMNSFTYYKPTNKLIGDYPRYVFFSKNFGGLNKQKVEMDKCRFKDELEKVSKTLEVKQKTV